MKKLWFLLLILLMLMGCATHQEFKYGGTEDNMVLGMTIFYQLEMSFTTKVEGKLVKVVRPMEMGKDVRLPESLNGLAIGLFVKNTKDIEYEVWEEYEVLYDKNTEPYYIKRRLNKSRLPEMVQSIQLPRQNGTEVVYKVMIVSTGGVNLFTIGDAKYSVGVN